MPTYRQNQEIARALRAPKELDSRAAHERYARWLDRTPDDEAALAAAALKLDLVEPRFPRPNETTRERNQRERTIVQAWKNLGWTNRDIQNHLEAVADGDFAVASSLGQGRRRREDTGPLTDAEAANFYHND